MWWEYVDSDANCADGLSRYFARDALSEQLGWTPREAPEAPWARAWHASRATLQRLLPK